MVRSLACAAIVVGMAACNGGDRAAGELVPASLRDTLTFETRTVRLRPEDRDTVTFTLAVPKQWTVRRALVAPSAGRNSPDVLVNGNGTPDPHYRYREMVGDPNFHTGHFELGISCDGECGAAEIARAFAQYDALKVLASHDSDTERSLTVENDDGGAYVVRAWRVAGDTSWRSCWAFVDKRVIAAVHAFEAACANVVETDTPQKF